MKPISSMLTGDLNSLKTVNSNINNINTVNVNSNKEDINDVNSITVANKIEKLLEEEGIKPEAVAKMLAVGLSDNKSLSFYLIVAKEGNSSKLLEALSITKDAEHQGKIRTKNSPSYFIGILRNWGIKTKFKKDDK